MIKMTVRELIEELEEYPSDLPVVVDGCEATEIVVRKEEYFSADHSYKDEQIVKVY